MNKLWCLVFSCLVLVGCLEAPSPIELAERQGALTEAELIDEEVQTAVEDAACFCEAWMIVPAQNAPLEVLGKNLRPMFVEPEDTGPRADLRLKAYADAFRSNGARVACGFKLDSNTGKWVPKNGDLSPQSPHGAVPVRDLSATLVMKEEQDRNSCVSNKTTWSIEARNPESPAASFCRADFNYCIAQQLQIKAESLAKAPSSRAARDAIYGESRARFALAGNVYTTTFLDTGLDHCGDNASKPAVGQGVCANFEMCADWRLPVVASTHSSTHTLHKPIDCPLVCDEDPGEVIGAPTCRPQCNDTLGAQCDAFANSRKTTLKNAIPESAKQADGTSARAMVTTKGTVSAMTCTVTGATAKAKQNDAAHCLCKEEKKVHRDKAECERVSGTYGDKLLARMVDTVSQVGELTAREATSRMAAADSIPVPSSTEDLSYGDRVFGEGSSRIAAAMTIAGTPPESVVVDEPYAHDVQVDGRATQMLELLIRFQVTLPYRICQDDSLAGFIPLTLAERTKWHLDMLKQLGETARAQLKIPGSLGGAELVRTKLKLNESDVGAALRLLADQLHTLDVDHRFVQAQQDPSASDCSLATFALDADGISQRPHLVTAATLALGHKTMARANAEGWDKANAEELRPLGGRGQVHLLRKNLAQLHKAKLFSGNRQKRVADAVRVADAYAGDSWTDHQRVCTPSTCAHTWRAIGDVITQGATLGLSASVADVACLTHGHVPGVSPRTSCPSSAFTPFFESASEPKVHSWSNRPQRTFTVSRPLNHNGRLFVMEKRCAPQGPCGYRLLDVLDTAVDDAVHAVGGELDVLLERALAKSVTDPARARENSLGVSNDLIPAMSFGFTGTVLDGWYQQHVTNAQSTANELAQRLQAQYQEELKLINLNQVTTFQAASLADAHDAVLEELCGGPADNCKVPRVEEVTLGELGLVPAPGADPGGADNKTCVEFLSTYSFTVPTDDIASKVGGELKAALRCTRWLTLTLAHTSVVSDLPVSVVVQTKQGAETAIFDDLDGKIREQHITLFQALRDVRVAMRQFDVTFQVAMQQLEIAIKKMDEGEPSWWQQFTCYSTRILTSVAAVAAAVAVFATPVGGGVLAVIATVGAFAGAGASTIGAVDTLVNIDECSNSDAAQLAAREAFAKVIASCEELKRLGDTSSNLVMNVARIDTTLDSMVRQVEIAQSRFNVDTLAGASNWQFSPAWRFAQAVHARELRNDLADTQRNLFEARRAMEFRTGEDLRFISTHAAFEYGAPRTWANDVFGLDFPGGTGEGHLGVVMGKAVKDHGKRLYDFMHKSYGEYRPFALAETQRIMRLSDALGDHTAAPSEAPLWQLMSFRCNDTEPALWFVGGHVPGDEPEDAPCESSGGVAEARVTFHVPSPLRDYWSSALKEANESNYRIVSVALNVYGAALQLCAISEHQSLCEDNKNLSYWLRHDQDVWVDNFEGNRRLYEMQPGVLQGEAKAADALINTFTLPEMVPYEERQLKDRPLSGTFTVHLQNPEGRTIAWENLEDIQLVLRYEHWHLNN